MTCPTPSVLHFELTSNDGPREVMDRFLPQGKRVLNRTEWLGKEPRSCGITQVRMRSRHVGSSDPFIFDIEVTYRPKGSIWYVGKTRYDGWTAMLKDQAADGTLLDGHGNPLPEGAEPVWRSHELFNDIEFNDVDFGSFVGESELREIERLNYETVVSEIYDSPKVSSSIYSDFVAPRRSRPLTKIVLSNSPSGVRSDGFGTRIVNINNQTPRLRETILDEVTELVSGFVEGRYSIANIRNDENVLVELSDVLVDCTPNETGDEARFGILGEYVSDEVLDELALRLKSTYKVEVSVARGEKLGLLLRRETT